MTNKQAAGQTPIYFTTEETAVILGVTQASIRRYIKAGNLRAYKVLDRWKVKREDLQDFIERSGRAALSS